MTKRIAVALAGLMSVAVPAVAVAAPSWVTANVNLRAGPGTQYPAIMVLNAGSPVEVYGCLQYYSWCDISFYHERGWVSSKFLSIFYDQRQGYTPYRPQAYVPFVTFDAGYWDRYYVGRPWYANRRPAPPVYGNPPPSYPPPGWGNPPPVYRPPVYQPPVYGNPPPSYPPPGWGNPPPAYQPPVYGNPPPATNGPTPAYPPPAWANPGYGGNDGRPQGGYPQQGWNNDNRQTPPQQPAPGQPNQWGNAAPPTTQSPGPRDGQAGKPCVWIDGECKVPRN